MKRILNCFIALLPLFAVAQETGQMAVRQTLKVGGVGGWDYLAVSPVHNWLYVSHSTQVNIVDKISGDSIGIIPNTAGVHGIAFDTAHKKGFVSCGKINNVTVFDINSNQVLANISTGANPDAIMYEPFTKMIITCNGHGNNLTFIDPVMNVATDSLALGGKPETAVSDSKGFLYVNIEDKNEIAVIDLVKKIVVNHWSLAPGEGPSGLVMDQKTRRLFATCDELLVVLNADNGKVVSKLPIGEGCDGAAFDAISNNVYTSNGAGTMTIIHEKDADNFVVTDNVITKRSGRTITIDPTTQKLYIPVADFEPQAEGDRSRPKIIPGSFRILMLGLQ